MKSKTLNRVGMVLSETGSAYTSVVADTLISNRFNTPVEAGGEDGQSYWWMIEEDNNYMIFEGTLTVSSPSEISIDVIHHTKEGGVYGTNKLDLSGNATLRAVTPAEMFDYFAPKFNYVLNGAMMVSQENGSSAGTVTGYYPVDQFTLVHASDGTVSVSQVASDTPAGSPSRIRVTITSTDTSLSSAQRLGLRTKIEGRRMANLNFGLSSAKTITLRFGVKAPAGTYGVSFVNAAANRCYVGLYEIEAGEANTDVYKKVTLVADTSGTWNRDSSNVGVEITWAMAAGSGYQGTADLWTSTEVHTTSAQYNLLGVNGNVFELFDVGLYEGANAPAFVVPDFETELGYCQRYWDKSYAYGTAVGAASGGLNAFSARPMTDGNTTRLEILEGQFRVEKRTAPTVEFYNGVSASGSGVVAPYNAPENPRTVSSVATTGTKSLGQYINTSSAVQTTMYIFHWTANARL